MDIQIVAGNREETIPYTKVGSVTQTGNEGTRPSFPLQNFDLVSTPRMGFYRPAFPVWVSNFPVVRRSAFLPSPDKTQSI